MIDYYKIEAKYICRIIEEKMNLTICIVQVALHKGQNIYRFQNFIWTQI